MMAGHHSRAVKQRVAIKQKGMACTFCGVHEPDSDDVCPKTGAPHSLVSFWSKGNLGQGKGDGPDADGVVYNQNTIGYGGSVGTDGEEMVGGRDDSPQINRRNPRGQKAREGSLHTADGGMAGGFGGAALAGPEEDEGPALADNGDGPVQVQAPAPPPPSPSTVAYCPFCGSAGVVGRSDGSIECSYDNAVFSVEQRRQFPFAPGEDPGQATAEGPMVDLDDDDDEGEDEENPFAGGDEDPDEDPSGYQDPVDDGSEISGSQDVPPPFQKRSYLSATGVLSYRNYLRRVALAVSDDPEATLAEMRKV